MAILNSINSPEDLKKISQDQLIHLAQEIRTRLIQVTSNNGGHIGPNLGVVELTLALCRVFDFPNDQITFDVAHQGYVYKLLTGRKGDDFDKIRQTGGVSGFLSREESPYDFFGAGHAGTALSAALGIAKARDLRGSDEHVITLIGDAALTCGITMEALNNVATTTKRLIVVLNDNEWSIAKNVGAIAKYLNELIINPIYNRLHRDIESFLEKIPGGESLIRLGSKAKQETKDFFVPSSLFEKYNLRYIGPIDGHNQQELIQYLEFCKQERNQPILLHVLTKKGQGYDIAINNPEKFHGTGPFEIETGNAKTTPGAHQNYDVIFGSTITKLAQQDEKILGITAAMPSGTGLYQLAKACPNQFFDVGIAEEHAVLFAAGLATQGFKPVCAIYSTFLQRAYDPIIHDVCLQNLKVLFCMDRAGLSWNDGPTHHGLFDIAYLRPVPNVILMQPKDEDELIDMIHTGLTHSGPAFIRYPRGATQGVPIKAIPELLSIGKAEIVREGGDLAIWALGTMVIDALKVADELKQDHSINACVVNARFAKPIDIELLQSQAQHIPHFVTMEDHVVTGGFGAGLLEVLQECNIHAAVTRIGWPDKFIPHGSTVKILRTQFGIDHDSIMKKILQKHESLNFELV